MYPAKLNVAVTLSGLKRIR